jgi:hypothetical protein
MPRGLAHRVGRALKPIRVVGCLFRRQDVDEPARERIHVIALRNVAVERHGVELRQHEDAPHVGVQTIADRYVDEAIFTANRYRRLRSRLCEGEKARPLAAAKDDAESVVDQALEV